MSIGLTADPIGIPPHPSVMRRLELLTRFMDSAVRIPGTSRTVGADAVLSVVPGAGSLMGMGVSLYLVAEALRHGAPLGLLARMGGNILADTALGAIPVVGIVFDMFFKSNQRNLDLLRTHFEGRGA